MLKFKRIKAGHYATTDGTYEVVKDATGYVTIEEREGDGINCGCDDDGWVATYGDVNLDWFDTKREAIEACNRHADKEIRDYRRIHYPGEVQNG
jgi:hypothetical protein